MEAVRRRQESFDGRLDRKSVNAGIEDRFMLDHDDVGVIDGARRHGRHQRQRVVGDIAQRQSAGLPPGMRIDQRGHEGRIEAPPLRHDPLKGAAAPAEPEGNDDASQRDAEQSDAGVQGNRRPGAVNQGRRDRKDECCSAGQNGQNGARVLRDEEGSRAREHQRHVGGGQLQCAVIMFDRRRRGDGGRHQAGQQYRPFEIADDERDRGRAEEQRRDREGQVLGAAFCQQNNTDCRQQYQGQDHTGKVTGDGRNSMIDHTPCLLVQAGRRRPSFTITAAEYGSRRSPIGAKIAVALFDSDVFLAVRGGGAGEPILIGASIRWWAAGSLPG